jgi:RND family efflux transporter MFP subunit
MIRSKNILIPIAILITGVLIAAAMIFFKPKTSSTGATRPALMVQATIAAKQTLPAMIRATGVVSAAKEITLLPEVSGRVVFLSDKLVPGGRFQKGELLARIDRRNYSLAVRQAESQVKQVELALQLEQSRQGTAKKEWELLGDDRPESEAALALRKPHLAAAEELVYAANSSLEQAKINLGRTSLRAPFNCVVLDERIDVGQVIGPNSVVATLAGSDQFRVTSSVRVDQLGLINIPGFNAESGSAANVVHDLGGGEKAVREALVMKLAGRLDPKTRTAQILVSINNPMDPPDGYLPILIGAYVDIEITGRDVPDVYLLERSAVVDGSTVWIVDENNSLSSTKVEIAWSDENTVAVSEGLAEGDRIVSMPPALPIEGMPVRIMGEPEETGVTTPVVGDSDES